MDEDSIRVIGCNMASTFDVQFVLTALQKGEMALQGQFLQGSNYTFLAELKYEGKAIKVVYKPTRGEAPLWDFPTGTLAKREVVAYWISEALGWGLIPPTVYRREGPLGPGSVQQYVEHDSSYHYFSFQEKDRQRLRPVILFDYISNNADRKGSHVLFDEDSHLWLIDHGLCFHSEEKLRTVIWDFAGQNIPESLMADLNCLYQQLRPDSDLHRRVTQYLKNSEVEALRSRIKKLTDEGCFPMPPTDRRVYPWPPV